jgi:hypothetical protein
MKASLTPQLCFFVIREFGSVQSVSEENTPDEYECSLTVCLKKGYDWWPLNWFIKREIVAAVEDQWFTLSNIRVKVTLKHEDKEDGNG